MAKLSQRVDVSIQTTKEGPDAYITLEDSNDHNLISKIGAWVRLALIQHNVREGAELVVRIHPVEEDEFANPER